MVTMELTVPPGAIGGQLLTVTGPSGRDVSMMLPQGARPVRFLLFQGRFKGDARVIRGFLKDFDCIFENRG